MERIRAMLSVGTIRRVRQTLLATSLAEGALVAWKVPPEKLESAFDYMFRQDPFSGHVVVRSTDPGAAGGEYKLWTTIKVPQGFGVERHAHILLREVGGEKFISMPAKGIFALGVAGFAVADNQGRALAQFGKETVELREIVAVISITHHDPFSAPVGSVLVYGTSRSVGHVEFRTKDGFVSDFRSPTPSRRPLLGVYAKL